jgi:hypothetical protein
MAVLLVMFPNEMWSDLLLEPPDAKVFFAGRRSACLFLYMACTSFSQRDLQASDKARSRYCLSAATAFTAVIVLGLWELYSHKMAKPAIWKAIIIEILFAGAYIYYAFEKSEKLEKNA